jgi:Anti-sigma factor NepR
MRFAMADDEGRVQRKGQGRDRGRRVDRRSEAGFDRWLVDQLRKLYDEVLDEEVPEELVRVVRAFDAGQGGEAYAARERSRPQESPRAGRSRRPAADRGASKAASAKQHSRR